MYIYLYALFQLFQCVRIIKLSVNMLFLLRNDMNCIFTDNLHTL